MITSLLALILFMQSPIEWKEQVYRNEYNKAVIRKLSQTKSVEVKNEPVRNRESTISWYAKGLKDPQSLTTACWEEYPKGTQFKVTYGGNSVIVGCTDRGHFRELGRFLDLSSGAFSKLAPLSRGIIRGAKVEVLK